VRVRATLALLKAGSDAEPLKIRSDESEVRIDFIDCSPRTKRIASAIFDFPLPFGPTIPVISLFTSMTVFFAKDLKPEIVIVERRMEEV
jgi:hypothetical protein